MFFQLFTIMGNVVQQHRGEDCKIDLPFDYALLESKQESAYDKVLEIVLSSAERSVIRIRNPQTIMSDFELAIINAAKNNFPENSIELYLFHSCQSVYRHIQSQGLQQRYSDPTDLCIREAARSMCALAFVPAEQVPEIFDICGIMKHRMNLYLLLLTSKIRTFEELQREVEDEQ